MNNKAFLVDYNLCDGCRLCEEGCCREHNWSEEQSGVLLSVAGPYVFPSGKTETYFVAVPTDFCDCCEMSCAPACAAACPKGCIELVMRSLWERS